MRPEWGKRSSKATSMAFDKMRLMPRSDLTQGRSNIEHEEEGVKAMEEMDMVCARSSGRL